jgi:hypothetical protein
VQVLAAAADARLAVVAEQRFEFGEQVRVLPEMAEVPVAGGLRFGHRHLHRVAVVAVEAVALDDGGLDALAAKDVLEGSGDGGGACAGGSGDGNDGMFG